MCVAVPDVSTTGLLTSTKADEIYKKYSDGRGGDLAARLTSDQSKLTIIIVIVGKTVTKRFEFEIVPVSDCDR